MEGSVNEQCGVIAEVHRSKAARYKLHPGKNALYLIRWQSIKLALDIDV